MDFWVLCLNCFFHSLLLPPSLRSVIEDGILHPFKTLPNPYSSCAGSPNAVFHAKIHKWEIREKVQLHEPLPTGWEYIGIQVIPKESGDFDCPLQTQSSTPPEDQDQPLSYSKALQFVANTNFKNSWKSTFRKHWTPFPPGVSSLDSPSKRSHSESPSKTLKGPSSSGEIIRRSLLALHPGLRFLERSDKTVIRKSTPVGRKAVSPFPEFQLRDKHRRGSGPPRRGSSLIPCPAFALEDEAAFFIFYRPLPPRFSLCDALSFSPALFAESHAVPLFILSQVRTDV
ncbi:unnamed protein product, partial [Cyprideis torosa]